MDDHYQNYTGVTEDINKAIKATARTITKSKLSDRTFKIIVMRCLFMNFITKNDAPFV